MRRVMIVDDEKLIRDGLTHLIDWESYGYQIVYCAADGKSALEYLQDHELQLILSDIRMPHFDGLEMAKMVRQMHPSVAIVFISGYDDFSLVREALQLGACDYLLKPLEPSVLIELLGKLEKELEKRTASDVEIKRLRQDAQQAIRIRKQRLLKQLLLGRMPHKQEDAELLALPAQYAYGLMVAEIDHFIAHNASLNAEQMSLTRDRLWEALQAELPYDATVFELGDGIFGICALQPLNTIDAYCAAIGEEQLVLKSSQDHVSMFYGGHTDSLDQIPLLYQKALRKREMSYAYTPHAVDKQQMSHSVTLAGTLPNDACDAVIAAVQLNDTGLLHKRILELELAIGQQGGQSFLYAQVMYANLFAQATRKVVAEGGSISEVFPEPMEAYRTVSGCQSLHNATEQMERLLSAIVEYRLMRVGGNAKSQIMKAKHYIDLHLADTQLSMQNVAVQFSMSTSYFSTEFHKVLGYTFTDYLILARMQRAKELLQHSQLKIYEISENVGYQNTTYFSTLFKKHYGISPKQFRA